MTNADKRMNLYHLGSDPADIRIHIRINEEIQIRIPDHFCLRFRPWRRFALPEHSLVFNARAYVISILKITYLFNISKFEVRQTCACFGVPQFYALIADILALEELFPELYKPWITSVAERCQVREVFIETCNDMSRQHCRSCVLQRDAYA